MISVIYQQSLLDYLISRNWNASIHCPESMGLPEWPEHNFSPMVILSWILMAARLRTAAQNSFFPASWTILSSCNCRPHILGFSNSPEPRDPDKNHTCPSTVGSPTLSEPPQHPASHFHH